MELGLEVDATSGVTVEVELNPLFSGSLFGEEVEGELSFGNVDALVATMGVEDLDVHLMGDQTSVDLHVLASPLWVLATVVGD